MKIYLVFDNNTAKLIATFFEEYSLNCFLTENDQYDRYNTRIIITTGYDNTDEVFDEIQEHK